MVAMASLTFQRLKGVIRCESSQEMGVYLLFKGDVVTNATVLASDADSFGVVWRFWL